MGTINLPVLPMLKPWEVVKYLERYMMKKYLESLEAESESDSYLPNGVRHWPESKRNGSTGYRRARREM